MGQILHGSGSGDTHYFLLSLDRAAGKVVFVPSCADLCKAEGLEPDVRAEVVDSAGFLRLAQANLNESRVP